MQDLCKKEIKKKKKKKSYRRAIQELCPAEMARALALDRLLLVEWVGARNTPFINVDSDGWSLYIDS
jgi:hypothetical protein